MRYLAFLSLVTALVVVLYGASARPVLASSGAAQHIAQVYSPSHPAPVVPAGASVVSQSATSYGTLVVYLSGGLYYNVNYAPDGRYIYTVTHAPAVPAPTTTTTPTTVPATGGAMYSTGGANPSTPVVPWLIGLALIALGVTARRLSRAAR
jgi:hypothetical protein